MDVKNWKKKKKYKISLKLSIKKTAENFFIKKKLNFFFFFFFIKNFLKLTKNLQLFFFKKYNKIFFFKKKLKINFFIFLKNNNEFKKIIKLKRLCSFFYKKLNMVTLKEFLLTFNKKLKKKKTQEIQLNYYKKIKSVFFLKKKKKLQITNFFYKKLTQKKYRKNKIFTYKKVFKPKKKQACLEFSKFLGYNRLKNINMNAYLINLEKKSFFSTKTSLNSNIFFILKTFFFFLNMQLFNFLIKKKYISLNFNPIQTNNTVLKPGDFFQFLKTKGVVTFFNYWAKSQKKYFNQLKKKLFFLKKKKKKNKIKL